MATNLITYSKDILHANKLDLDEASKGGSSQLSCVSILFFSSFCLGLKSSLLARLGLSEKKLQTLSKGLAQIADKADVLGSFFNLLSRIFAHQ